VVLVLVPEEVVLQINVLGQAFLRDLPEAEFEADIARSFIDTRVHDERMRGARTILVDVADDLGAELISVNAFFERDGRYAWLLNRVLLYKDADHISAPAAHAVAPLLDKALFGDGRR
ncbi:MAG: SGNH hydrolase domain-containing protein, partial [Roseovarius confluentis]